MDTKVSIAAAVGAVTVVAVLASLSLDAVSVTTADAGRLRDGGRIFVDAGPQLPAPVTTCRAAPARVCDARDLSIREDAGLRYRRVEVPAVTCTTTQRLLDGGSRTILTETHTAPDAGRLEVLFSSCALASVEGGTRILDGGVRFAAQACFCRKAAGSCVAPILIDGGVASLPFGMTARGATGDGGCQPKSCAEFFGESSWPSACPGG